MKSGAPPSSPIHPDRGGEFLRTIAVTGEPDALEVGMVIAAIASYWFGMDDEVEASAAATVQRLLEVRRDLALRPVR